MKDNLEACQIRTPELLHGLELDPFCAAKEPIASPDRFERFDLPVPSVDGTRSPFDERDGATVLEVAERCTASDCFDTRSCGATVERATARLQEIEASIEYMEGSWHRVCLAIAEVVHRHQLGRDIHAVGQGDAAHGAREQLAHLHSQRQTMEQHAARLYVVRERLGGAVGEVEACLDRVIEARLTLEGLRPTTRSADAAFLQLTMAMENVRLATLCLDATLSTTAHEDLGDAAAMAG